jgi:hypothetical protein
VVEAVTAGLHEVLNLNWREGASKVCVFIADARVGRRLPQWVAGRPRPIGIIRVCGGCGADAVDELQGFARDFMMMVASVTGAKFLSLGKADILAKVIVAPAIEGIEMEELWMKLEAEVAAEAAKKNEALTKEQLCDLG